ncbi:hypothetical protein [Oceanobacillus sp. FSL H7-0719]|uniref:hypothetical protein n=1 Tax=Oceanobacillus sp. FSL H7-0719 TaxID=2954507 RepID=UPI003246B5FA
MNGIVLPGLAPCSYEDVKGFLQKSKFAKRRFEEASEVIGYSLYEAFKESSELDYEVRETSFLTNTIALLDHFHEDFDVEPDILIGPSFGGMATAVKTESLTYAEMIWLTHESAKIAKVFYQNTGDFYQTMFIYNLSIEEANELVNEFQSKNMYLELVGNLEKVICLCGSSESIKILQEIINRKSKVIATHTMQQPIHSKVLSDLKEELRVEVFNQVQFKPLKHHVISDVNGNLVRDPMEFKQTLLDGYDHTVRWDLVTNRMRQMKLQTIYVVGPQNIFSQLLKKQWETTVITPRTVQRKLKELV